MKKNSLKNDNRFHPFSINDHSNSELRKSPLVLQGQHDGCSNHYWGTGFWTEIQETGTFSEVMLENFRYQWRISDRSWNDIFQVIHVFFGYAEDLTESNLQFLESSLSSGKKIFIVRRIITEIDRIEKESVKNSQNCREKCYKN